MRRGVLGALVILALFAPSAHAADTALVGTFGLTGGACAGGKATGTYFRMVQPSGTVKDGPFVSNGDSTCSDTTYTLLAPGSDGGLIAGSYQPAPNPVFDGNGNALASRIAKPATFFGRKFALSTDHTDLQTKKAVPAVAITTDGSALKGNVTAWSATWNNQYFNQGAPKPDGSTPGLTTPAHGTYNPSTGAFVLEWTSSIVGGPFNNFTGSWHLEGTFRAASSGSGAPVATGSGTKTTVAGVPTNATTVTTAAAADTATTVADSADNTTGTIQAVKAVDSKGWNPPAWLIVVTALLGVGAAASLLRSSKERTEA